MPPARRPAFSLVEIMIAMVILGLGLVMVATMFPVAWTRARTLSEYTVRGSIAPAAAATARSVLRVAGPSLESASFAGDLIVDRGPLIYTNNPLDAFPANSLPEWPTETWVHALNMQNITVDTPALVPEDPWQMEVKNADVDRPVGLRATTIGTRSYYDKQLEFHQRLHPPIRRRDGIDPSTGQFTNPDDAWDDEVAMRRYAWSVLHRLRDPVPTTLEELPERAASTRSFDIYYVTLRRPQPTNRYARQNPESVPDPYDLMIPPIVPAARPPRDDVMFPIAWRVQVSLPDTLAVRNSPAGPDGVPTEIQVPPRDFAGSDRAKLMLVQMFPVGAQFIDEVTGAVYRVARQRITGALGEQAFLTLDREIVVDEIDLSPTDPRCSGFCSLGIADAAELLRTVWVYPPPVEDRAPGEKYPFFRGGSPVVGIDVRTLNVTP